MILRALRDGCEDGRGTGPGAVTAESQQGWGGGGVVGTEEAGLVKETEKGDRARKTIPPISQFFRRFFQTIESCWSFFLHSESTMLNLSKERWMFCFFKIKHVLKSKLCLCPKS